MQNNFMKVAAMAALVALGSSAFANAAEAGETLRYEWRLRGALSWIARAKFPTSGTGVLQTQPRAGAVESQLRVSAGGRDYIEYVSRMAEDGEKTFASTNGYSLGNHSERKETTFDYVANVANVKEHEAGKVGSKTRPLSADIARDALTTITWLRENAASVSKTLTTDIYSDGKPYRVRIEPAGFEKTSWQGRDVQSRVFKISAAPGSKKKFPGLTVWLSEDEQRLPLRMVFDQPLGASLDLRLKG
ncbi:MAG: DUF3108 domain-containing protein [Thermoanaerobaculia bacterium]